MLLIFQIHPHSSIDFECLKVRELDRSNSLDIQHSMLAGQHASSTLTPKHFDNFTLGIPFQHSLLQAYFVQAPGFILESGLIIEVGLY